MNNLLSKWIILIASLLSFTLVGCSTNTQGENTGIGGVSGAVVGGLAGSLFGGGAGKVLAVGVGAIAGALVGGSIGHNMDSSDNSNVHAALENNPENRPMRWRNTTTGRVYTVIPTSGRITVNGNPDCRRYRTTAIMNGNWQHVYGTACRTGNGTWVAVSN